MRILWLWFLLFTAEISDLAMTILPLRFDLSFLLLANFLHARRNLLCYSGTFEIQEVLAQVKEPSVSVLWRSLVTLTYQLGIY